MKGNENLPVAKALSNQQLVEEALKELKEVLARKDSWEDRKASYCDILQNFRIGTWGEKPAGLAELLTTISDDVIGRYNSGAITLGDLLDVYSKLHNFSYQQDRIDIFDGESTVVLYSDVLEHSDAMREMQKNVFEKTEFANQRIFIKALDTILPKLGVDTKRQAHHTQTYRSVVPGHMERKEIVDRGTLRWNDKDSTGFVRNNEPYIGAVYERDVYGFDLALELLRTMTRSEFDEFAAMLEDPAKVKELVDQFAAKLQEKGVIKLEREPKTALGKLLPATLSVPKKLSYDRVCREDKNGEYHHGLAGVASKLKEAVFGKTPIAFAEKSGKMDKEDTKGVPLAVAVAVSESRPARREPMAAPGITPADVRNWQAAQSQQAARNLPEIPLELRLPKAPTHQVEGASTNPAKEQPAKPLERL